MSDPNSLHKEIAKIEGLIVTLRETLSGDALDQALLPLQQKHNLLMAQLSGCDRTGRKFCSGGPGCHGDSELDRDLRR